MKISVYKYHVTDKTISYSKARKIADILESSDYLENEVLEFRKKHNLPMEGYPLKTQMDYLILSDLLGKLPPKALISLCEKIAKKLKIPSYWSNSMVEVILCNQFNPPLKDGFVVMPTADIGTEEDPFSGKAWAMNNTEAFRFLRGIINEKAVILGIRQKLTKTQLKKLIDQNWKEIEAGMATLPEIKLHNVQRMELVRLICELRDTHDMKFAEIANYLAKYEYQDDLELYDLLTEDYVKNLYNRWKKRSKKASLS